MLHCTAMGGPPESVQVHVNPLLDRCFCPPVLASFSAQPDHHPSRVDNSVPPAASSGPERGRQSRRAGWYVQSSILFPPLKVRKGKFRERASDRGDREEDLELENMARLCGRRGEADRVEESQRGRGTVKRMRGIGITTQGGFHT